MRFLHTLGCASGIGLDAGLGRHAASGPGGAKREDGPSFTPPRAVLQKSLQFRSEGGI
jgi:hypothetical protein